MKRVRLIVGSVSLSKKGEVRFFDLRLPNNTLRVLGVEHDVFIHSPYTPPALPVLSSLEWRAGAGLCAGKLKLRSRGREAVFYEAWVTHIPHGHGLPDMSFGILPLGSLTIDRLPRPKLLNLVNRHLLLEGLFEDVLGAATGQDLQYELRIFLWVETDEPSKGLSFGFDNQKAGDEKNNLNLLQLKL